MKKLFALLICLAMLCAVLSVQAEEITVSGKVIEIEKYGHALLDITIEDFTAAGFELGDVIHVTAGTFSGDLPYYNGYYVEKGDPMVRAYPGHTNIAVCINYGKFNEVAGIDVGDTVTLSLKEKAGMLTVQEINNLVYSNERADYASDEIFANFRPVVMGNIAEGKLYRAASPIENQNGRAGFVSTLMEAAGVKAVINMANTEEELAACFAAEDFASPYYKGLCDAGNVIALGMPVNYSSDEFADGIVKGLVFLAEHEGPYLVHCTEGKDRAGFMAMVLEALGGASCEEMVADYMLSYVNYYGIEPGSDKYEMIAEKNIMDMIRTVAGLEKGASLEGIDLKAAAEAYLAAHGMSAETIAQVEANLAP